ncbi:hypothetical protein X797_009092 [Metarhizium robertsii]|uniref:Uncharacterized protein n=1 Tax=Metarhizium robertsii TaxID=568076 RepID=A0A014PMB7_9HYPO|nr:hypothetical protein X797_009092 [Metarhizium robertsii]
MYGIGRSQRVLSPQAWRSSSPEQSDLDGKVALVDFLSHRTGLSGDMSIALQGDLEFMLAPSDTLPAVSRLNTVAPFRKS